jgi:predicted RecB family nuclease
MATIITSDVLESYLNCRYKGHLRLAGQEGTKGDYEVLLTEKKRGIKLAAIEKLRAEYPADKVESNAPLTVATLRTAPRLIFDARFEDDLVCLDFDGLKRLDGPSKLGGFHYIPMLFFAGPKIDKARRLLLELYGLLLSRLQGRTPAHGIIWKGQECRPTKVRLGRDPRFVERFLRDLKALAISKSLPQLILNDHCQVCEFRQRCNDQAIREDNLSLLRSMGAKEIKRYSRKGILTLTQLAHTFRPRRKPKRAAQSSKKRYHALQAMAIRDKCIYVFGTPQIPTSPVLIYLDVESIPELGFVYLIGLIVVENGCEKHYSLWADSRDQERHIFEQFLAVVARYEDFIIFSYGSLEKAVLKRLRRLAKRKKLVDKVLNRLVNTLSIIHSHVYLPAYSNGLKVIGSCLGCTWTEANASGVQSTVWRGRWESAQDEAWKQKLLTYNLEDCKALLKVTQMLYVIARPCGQGLGNYGKRRSVPKATEGQPWDTATLFSTSNGRASSLYCRADQEIRDGLPATIGFSSMPFCMWPRQVSPGAICQPASVTGTPCTSASAAGAGKALGNECSKPCRTRIWNG